MVAQFEVSKRYNDLMHFMRRLNNNYGINLIEKTRTPAGIFYGGTFYSPLGELYELSVICRVNSTDIQVYKQVNRGMKCEFQKRYNSDENSTNLSNSSRLFNYLDKIF